MRVDASGSQAVFQTGATEVPVDLREREKVIGELYRRFLNNGTATRTEVSGSELVAIMSQNLEQEYVVRGKDQVIGEQARQLEECRKVIADKDRKLKEYANAIAAHDRPCATCQQTSRQYESDRAHFQGHMKRTRNAQIGAVIGFGLGGLASMLLRHRAQSTLHAMLYSFGATFSGMLSGAWSARSLTKC